MGFLSRILGGRAQQLHSSVRVTLAQPHVPEIGAQQLAEALEGLAPVILIDVRELWEWQTGHLDGAMHIPLNTLPQHVDALDKTADTVVYCHLGHRSWYATAYLQQQGFTNVASLAGGIEAWQRAIHAG